MANLTNGDGFPASSSNIPISSIENTQDEDALSGISENRSGASVTRDSTADSEASSTPPRPNRFAGPSSTYRHHISPERTLHTSLLRQRAADLSLHLYNTHHLKLRVRDPTAPSNADIKPYHAKSRWVKRGEDGKPLWHPKDHWTAWPMAAEDVPREEERFGEPSEWWGDDGTFKVQEAWRPTQEMEEEIAALMMRKAKEDFKNARDCSPGDFDVEEAGESDVEMAETSDDEKGEDTLSAPSQEAVDDSEEPVMLADDETAAEILQPMVNDIMSKLDDLLRGLHTSIGTTRSYTRRTSSQPASRNASASRSQKRSRASIPTSDHEQSESDTSESQDGDGSNNASRSQSPAPSHKQSHRPTSTTANAKQPQDRNPVAKPPRRRTRHPRDWSTLLATASLVGWDPEVVQRAHQRCEDLFRERTDFFPIASSSQATSTARDAGAVTEQQAPSSLEAPDVARTDKSKGEKWVYCPVADCKRVEEPFREKWRWREHLQRVHKWDKATIAREEEVMQKNTNTSVERN